MLKGHWEDCFKCCILYLICVLKNIELKFIPFFLLVLRCHLCYHKWQNTENQY